MHAYVAWLHKGKVCTCAKLQLFFVVVKHHATSAEASRRIIAVSDGFVVRITLRSCALQVILRLPDSATMLQHARRCSKQV